MKKGFTLIELLIVIVIIGAIATLVLPGLLNNYNKAIAKIMKTEESTIKDSAGLAIKDYCNSPIKPVNRLECLYNPSTNPSSDKHGLIRENNGNYYVCLEDLYYYGYYDNDLKYEETECRAMVMFERNSNNQFVNPKTYIYCGEDYDYDYATDEDVSEYDFTGCYGY